MRPSIASAAVAVASVSAAGASITVGTEEDYNALLSKLVQDLINSTAVSSDAPAAAKTDLKEEHTPPAAGTLAQDAAAIEPDVGVLKLSSSPSKCPVACPQEMCECAQSEGTLKGCSKQIDELCTKSEITFCFDKEEYAPLYDLYCPTAACLEDGRPYEECRCEYYLDYCQLYWDYIGASTDTQFSCAIAKCCELSKTNEDKKACIAAETDLWPEEIWVGGNQTKKVGLWPKSKGPRPE